MSETEWSTIAFAPAAPGWSVTLREDLGQEGRLVGDGRRHELSVAGWLTQENEAGHRRFIAAIPTPQGVLVPVDSFPGFATVVTIRGPNDRDGD